MITRNCCRQNCHTVGKNNWKVFTSSKIDTTVDRISFRWEGCNYMKIYTDNFQRFERRPFPRNVEILLIYFQAVASLQWCGQERLRLCISYLCLFWKDSMYVIASPLTHIINLSISSGIFLILWKLPVSYNKYGDHRLFQNYSQCYLFFLERVGNYLLEIIYWKELFINVF
jgi:hypothetical protein